MVVVDPAGGERGVAAEGEGNCACEGSGSATVKTEPRNGSSRVAPGVGSGQLAMLWHAVSTMPPLAPPGWACLKCRGPRIDTRAEKRPERAGRCVICARCESASECDRPATYSSLVPCDALHVSARNGEQRQGRRTSTRDR